MHGFNLLALLDAVKFLLYNIRCTNKGFAHIFTEYLIFNKNILVFFNENHIPTLSKLIDINKHDLTAIILAMLLSILNPDYFN